MQPYPKLFLVPVLALLGQAGSVRAETQGMDRYRVIIDKAIFGKAPVAASQPSAAPAAAGPSYINDYRLCMINELSDGSVRVGLLNTKTQYTFLLQEGETDSQEGIELVSADYLNEEVKLSKNGEVRALSIDHNLVIAPTRPAPSRTVASRAGSTPSRTVPQVASNRGSSAAPPTNVKSYLERRAERRRQLVEAMKKREASKPKYSGKELEKHLQEYQMEVRRRGLPPLPVSLTPEQQEQLEKEGVGPPQ